MGVKRYLVVGGLTWSPARLAGACRAKWRWICNTPALPAARNRNQRAPRTGVGKVSRSRKAERTSSGRFLGAGGPWQFTRWAEPPGFELKANYGQRNMWLRWRQATRFSQPSSPAGDPVFSTPGPGSRSCGSGASQHTPDWFRAPTYGGAASCGHLGTTPASRGHIPRRPSTTGRFSSLHTLRTPIDQIFEGGWRCQLVGVTGLALPPLLWCVLEAGRAH